MTGLPLFDYQPPAPYQRDSETSREAAEAIEPVAVTVRAEVLDYVAKWGTGCTREEIAIQLCIPLQTVCARVNELIRSGHLIRTNERRMTISGRRAEVVVAKESRS